jgi:hypothetical protein
MEDISAEQLALDEHWKDSGVPMMAFNLKHERETGYFDEEGNYVAYREDSEDAWLASLPKGESLKRQSAYLVALTPCDKCPVGHPLKGTFGTAL